MGMLGLVMDKPSLVAVGIVSVSLLSTWVWCVFTWVWLRPRRLEKRLRQLGFSGNPYRFLHGDVKDTSKLRQVTLSNPITLSDDIVPHVTPFLHQTVVNHGKKCFMWLGPTPRVIIMDPEMIREIFTKFDIFQKPKGNPLVSLFVTGVASYEEDKWAKHRKIINPAFHLDKLKKMVPTFLLSCSEMVDKWAKVTSLGNDGVSELDVKPFLDSLTADVISRTAFGSSYEEGKMVFQLQKLQGRLFIDIMQTVYIPGWRFMPTKTNNKLKQTKKEVDALLRDIISKKMKALRAGESASDDLLGLLLESNIDGIREDKGRNPSKAGLSIEDVIEECKLFYIAGQETTSNLLAWTMVLLSKHQNWQARARDEVLQVYGDKLPDVNGLNNLKIVTMILHEVLRLYPPVDMLVRRTNKELTLGELHLPSGVELAVPVLLIHREKELWGEDAKEFNPERFSNGVSKAAKDNQSAFFPFGWGPRICVGQNFAMIEAKLALSMILQRFSFELSQSYLHAPLNVVTMQPQHGVPMILHKL